MSVYFFSRLAVPVRAQFRANYIRQNLETFRSISVIFFVLDAIFKIASYVLNLPADQFKNLQEYDDSITIHLMVTPLFFLLSFFMIKNFKQTPGFLLLAQSATILFSSYIIWSGMFASFLGMHNPRNTVTMYMVTLTANAIFYVFEYYETILIAIITGTIFTVLLPNYVHTGRELLLNQFASAVLIIVFISISRYVFSYRASHFVQLKTINEKNAQIEIANQVKDEILGIVAHDLRNPLAAIESIAMLMELDNNLDEEGMDNLLMIKASCERTRLIINDLIEVARNDVDNQFEVTRIDLNQFLFEIVKECLSNKKDTIKIVYYGTKQPVYSWINPDKMHRVMDNLISNAMKFSKDDDCIEVSLRHANGGAYIDVKDFGVGIPDDLLPSIFDRFSKASRKGLRGEDSVGLGLSIVKQIVSKHGGQINVKSTEKTGTTFTISLNQSLAS